MACRPRLWRKPSQPCFLPSKRWPVLNFNTSLTRTQHDEAHSRAPPLPSRSRPDVQRPPRLGKESRSPPQYTKLNPDGNLAAQVVQESSQTATADTGDVPESRPPFICDECGSIFRNEQGLHDHQQSLSGQAGGCKNRITIAETKVVATSLKPLGLCFSLPLFYEMRCTHSLTHPGGLTGQPPCLKGPRSS